jgi:hypothetical protein
MAAARAHWPRRWGFATACACSKAARVACP